MASTFWLIIGLICVVAIVTKGVVRIVTLTRSGGGKASARVGDLEGRLQDAEQDLADARKRIEVLEKIVTDEKYDLYRQIDDLAANN